MTVRKVADVQEEELEECESYWSKNYSQEYLYVKMTSKCEAGTSTSQRSRWPTLEQLRPRLKRASLLETSLEDEQVLPVVQISTASVRKKKTKTGQGEDPMNVSSSAQTIF